MNSVNFTEEVVCDEYQDSNQVQELILSLLSREHKGQYNRFMVGDVKQSIYRFRLADAAIFMEKYHHYALGESQKTRQRIDLSQNFRSRESVLSGVNYIFRKIMKKSILVGLTMMIRQLFIREWHFRRQKAKILRTIRNFCF